MIIAMSLRFYLRSIFFRFKHTFIIFRKQKHFKKDSNSDPLIIQSMDSLNILRFILDCVCVIIILYVGKFRSQLS